MSQQSTSRTKWILVLSVTVILVLALAGGFAYRAIGRSRQATQNAETQQKMVDAIADRLGIRINKVVVTADGGLVDLRYQVIDPDKAVFLFDNLDVVPKLIADNGEEIRLESLPHRHDVYAGLAYFILYRNVKNSVKPGSQVTVVVGDDLRLEHVAVAK
jgi:hypothetical protein